MTAPAWQRSPLGSRRYWTAERVREGLVAFIAANPKGPLPCRDRNYSAAKLGNTEWPPASRVLEFHGSMAKGFLAAGAPRSRVSLHNIDWTQEEEDYLLEHAGTRTLALIGKALGRSAGACRARLQLRGITARDATGYLSMQQVAREFNCPLSRVKSLIRAGVLPARKMPGANLWRIDPDALDERLRDILSAPKRQSYRASAPDLGDYDARYGYRRVIRDGKTVRLALENRR